MIPTLRPATLSDTAAILMLAEELHGKRRIPIPFDPGIAAQILAAMIGNPKTNLVDVQVEEGQLVGFVAATIAGCPFNAATNAVTIARHSRVQHGEALLIDRFESWGVRSGCAGIVICSAPEAQEQFARAHGGGGYRAFEVNFIRIVGKE